MFGRMRFSDYVIYKALESNTEGLRMLANVDDALTDRQVHKLRLSVKRLRASWYLFKTSVPPDQYREALRRLKRIHKSLAGARDERVLASTAAKLIGKAEKAKTRAALESLSAEFLRRAGLRRAEQIPIDLVAEGFQMESSVWRELDFPNAIDGAVLDGYAQAYRRGRKLGTAALTGVDVRDMHEWRRWVKFTYFHLDLIKPVLGDANLKHRWYLDRLGDTLGKHNDLDMLQVRLGDAGLSEREVNRIQKLITKRMAVFSGRAKKLYPRVYGPKPKAFRAAISKDVAGLALDNVVVIPRSA